VSGWNSGSMSGMRYTASSETKSSLFQNSVLIICSFRSLHGDLHITRSRQGRCLYPRDPPFCQLLMIGYFSDVKIPVLRIKCRLCGGGSRGYKKYFRHPGARTGNHSRPENLLLFRRGRRDMPADSVSAGRPGRPTVCTHATPHDPVPPCKCCGQAFPPGRRSERFLTRASTVFC
jgi:hypothetical protein